MKTLKIQNKVQTLVDQVEDKLLNFLKDNSLKVGDEFPMKQNCQQRWELQEVY